MDSVAPGVDENNFVSATGVARTANPKAICFCGDLGFGPNIDALQYFLKTPWSSMYQPGSPSGVLDCGCRPDR